MVKKTIAPMQYIQLSSEQSVPSRRNFLYMKKSVLNIEYEFRKIASIP